MRLENKLKSHRLDFWPVFAPEDTFWRTVDFEQISIYYSRHFYSQNFKLIASATIEKLRISGVNSICMGDHYRPWSSIYFYNQFYWKLIAILLDSMDKNLRYWYNFRSSTIVLSSDIVMWPAGTQKT